MKALNLEQMEQMEGGGFWAGVGCLAFAATVSVATGNPFVGIGANIVCQALLNPTDAY